MSTCACSHDFIDEELSEIGCSAYLHIKQAGEGRKGWGPILLPFPINQLKASPHFLAHLASFAMRTAKPES